MIQFGAVRVELLNGKKFTDKGMFLNHKGNGAFNAHTMDFFNGDTVMIAGINSLKGADSDHSVALRNAQRNSVLSNSLEGVIQFLNFRQGKDYTIEII